MYFEAEIKGLKYRLDVVEAKSEWRVNIQAEGQEKEFHSIPKADFTKFDEAVSFLFQGRSYMIDVVPTKEGMTIFSQGSFRNVKIFNDETLLHESLKRSGSMGEEGQITAGMPGKIVKLYVKPGDEVVANQPVLIMEAMKMENEIRASKAAVVKDVLVKEGSSVDSGAVLVLFES